MTALLKPLLRRIDFGTPLKDTASLSLDFASQQYYAEGLGDTFGEIVTFTRASSATYFDSAGVLQTAPTDAPRFDYDPVTLKPRGLLIEEARTNLLTYSEDFSNAAWTKQSSTINANAAASPAGTLTADKMVSAVGSSRGIYQFPIDYPLNTDCSASIYAKADGFSTLGISWNGNGTATFDLIAGTKTSGPTSAGIQSVGGGWYRCWTVAQRSTSGQAVTYRFGAAEQPVGDGVKGIYIWGAQLEVGAFPTRYIPTVASQVTRAADVASVNTLSPWYNATDGTLFVEGSTGRQDNAYYAVLYSSPSNYVLVRQEDSRKMEMRVATAGLAQAAIVSSDTNIVGELSKNAAAYGANSFTYALDGTLIGTDSTGAVPTVTALGIGGAPFGPTICGHIRTIRYFKTKHANFMLEGETL